MSDSANAAERGVEHVEFTEIGVTDGTIERVVEVLESGRYVKGPVLEEFESRFAEACGVDHAVGVANGTAALLLALQAAGIGPGDRVYVPGHSFFATVSPVLALGADPVFVDIDPDTYTMDPEALAAAVERDANGSDPNDADTAPADDGAEDPIGTPAAVVPVHIYGAMAEMDAIREVADEHDLFVLEDACQAHFATRDGETAGSAGDAGAFSFYPSKNMTVAGDGGMVTTDDAELAAEMRRFRNHGRGGDGVHATLGLNYRLDETNAAVGLAQLDRVQGFNERRNAAAARYTERLAEVEAVTTPLAPADAFHVYHLYVIQVPDRDGLREHLSDRGIDTGIHYDTALHDHPAVADHVGEVELPHAERLVDRIVSLPMHPEITDAEIDYVCESVAGYYQ